jgi:PAP_fibrillin
MQLLISQLLQALDGLQRGLRAGEEEKARIDALARELVKLRPDKKTLSSPLINGKWELLYTTSASILGTNRLPFLRPGGPIFQILGESFSL